MLRNKKAQSTLEYIIVFTVIVGAVLIAANGIINTSVQNILQHAGEEAVKAVNHISF